jgi:hypothetical protein
LMYCFLFSINTLTQTHTYREKILI